MSVLFVRRWRAAARFLVAGILLSSIAAGGALAAEAPRPSEGRWAATTLALLHHNRGLCEQLADDVLGYWGGLGSGNGEERVRDYVLHHSVSEIAEARAAGDLARRFLGGARSEVSLETGSSLERLSNLQGELCNLVALPTAPYTDYEASIRQLGERIDRERAELGRLLVVPETELRSALEPYLVPIQLAGVEAEGEFIDYLNSLKKEPEPPTMAELMADWYRVYQPAVAPVKAALGKFLRARKNGNRRALGESCREMVATVVPVLEHPKVLEPPDTSLRRPLRRAYLFIQKVGGSCTGGNFKAVDQNLADMQRELQMASRGLAKYSLRP